MTSRIQPSLLKAEEDPLDLLLEDREDFEVLVYHPRFLNLQRNSSNSWTVFVKHVDPNMRYVIQQSSGTSPSAALYAALNQGKK